MISFFLGVSTIYQALIAGLFTWLITSLGAAVVFFFKKISQNALDIMLSISAGIMLSSAFFSLLNPAVSLANELKLTTWLIVLIGFLLGCILLFVGDKYSPKFLNNKKISNLKRKIMLIISITLHNIPEGLAVGVAFGSISYNIPGASIISALILTGGIALQNFPEGSAISLPLRREKVSRLKSFLIGSLTGIVEPISSVIGALLVMKVRIALPIFLSFAAGAMVYVVIKEMIPECQRSSKPELMSIFTMLGFSLMMILEIIFS